MKGGVSVETPETPHSVYIYVSKNYNCEILEIGSNAV